MVHNECFVPIVYILKAESVDEAISWNNEVPQGLSSSIFTQNPGNIFKVRNRQKRNDYTMPEKLLLQLYFSGLVRKVQTVA